MIRAILILSFVVASLSSVPTLADIPECKECAQCSGCWPACKDNKEGECAKCWETHYLIFACLAEPDSYIQNCRECLQCEPCLVCKECKQCLNDKTGPCAKCWEVELVDPKTGSKVASPGLPGVKYDKKACLAEKDSGVQGCGECLKYLKKDEL
eukprot:NODE_8706_length_654_cov_80.129944_g8081_i0.p1 GENE.NODE_8706_length_654_cov_80.129944_g8081_i0~~NODE_8706_length_654_cov_80.129944_g8081_i0.p1  ORF type:complete len:154 (+),score=23.49 NODE_8706_length_654_cov_80.129944_g8081_i0:62-523(+)